jgi:hypothetical protein
VSIFTPKIGALEMGPNKQNDSFLNNDWNSFDWISIIYGDHLQIKLCGYCLHESNGMYRGSDTK